MQTIVKPKDNIKITNPKVKVYEFITYLENISNEKHFFNEDLSINDKQVDEYVNFRIEDFTDNNCNEECRYRNRCKVWYDYYECTTWQDDCLDNVPDLNEEFKKMLNLFLERISYIDLSNFDKASEEAITINKIIAEANEYNDILDFENRNEYM